MDVSPFYASTSLACTHKNTDYPKSLNVDINGTSSDKESYRQSMLHLLNQ